MESKDKYLQEHSFYNRITLLQDLTEANPELAESIDRDWLQASLTAGKQSRKVKKTWWSSTLAKAKQLSNLYRTLLSMLPEKQNYRPQLGRLQALNPSIDLPNNIHTCSKALREAQKQERTIINDSLHYREEEQLLQADISHISGDAAKATILQNIRKAEEIKQLFNKLRFI